MNRLVLVVAVLAALVPGTVRAQDATFTGQVPANVSAPVLVSPDAAAVLRPGQVVRVKLSGQVDINQERKRKKKCLVAGMGCKSSSSTRHHHKTPAQHPAVFLVRKVGSAVYTRWVVHGEAVDIPVPTGNFDDKYELVASLDGAGSTVDPGRSVGAYKVTVEVRAEGRANGYALWLQGNAPLDAKLSDEVLDAATRVHGDTLSAALRDYANQRYPLAVAANHAAHAKIVTKAYALAPAVPENSLALAKYYMAAGLDQEARISLQNAERLWSEAPEPRSPEAARGLGEAYLGQARTILKDKGVLDLHYASVAAAFFDKGIESLRRSNRQDLVAEALVDKARLLRSLRTRTALNEAAGSLKEALKLAPDRLAATTLLAPPSAGNQVRLVERPGVALTPIDASSTEAGPVPLLNDVPIAYDPFDQSLLVTRGPVLEWRSLAALDESGGSVTTEALTIAAGGGKALVSTGAENGFGMGAVYLLSKGSANRIKLIENYRCGGSSVAISPDGTTGVIECGSDDANVYRLAGTPARLKGYNSVQIAAPGPASCGVLIGRVDDGNDEMSFLLDRLNGTTTKLISPAGAEERFSQYLGDQHIAFSSDGKVIILRDAGSLAVFSCATGIREEAYLPFTMQSEPLPYRADEDTHPGAPQPEDWYEHVSLAWVSPSQLTIAQELPVYVGRTRDHYDLGAVEMVTWPERSSVQYRVPDAALSASSDMLDRLLLAPAGAGEPPRTPRAVASATVAAWLAHASPEQIEASVRPRWPAERWVLRGGGSVLYGGADSPAALFDTSSGSGRSFDDLRAAAPLAAEDRWFAFRQRPDGSFASAVALQGESVIEEKPLPPVRTSYFEKLLAFAAEDYFYDAELGSFPESELPRLRADPDLMSLRHGAGNLMPSLSAGGTGEARLLCGVPQARTAAGELRTYNLTFAFEQLTLAVPGASGPELLPVPSYRDAACKAHAVVRGPRPGVLLYSLTGGYSINVRVSWWDTSRWIDLDTLMDPSEVDRPSFLPFAGWGTDDGRLLLLTAEKEGLLRQRLVSDSTAKRQWQLRAATSSGTVTTACTVCGALELTKAVDRWMEAWCKPEAPADLAAAAECRFVEADFIKSDNSGATVVYPAGEELRVMRLSDGKELLRVPFGLPLNLESERLVVRHTGQLPGASTPPIAVYSLTGSGS